MNDTELVQQILNGNEHAFRYLVAKHQRLVAHVVGRIVQQQEDLEDICQEVFMKVFKQLKKFRGDARLSTWIAKIAYNTSITHLRRRNKEVVSYDDQPLLVNLKQDENLNQAVVERNEIKKILMDCIEKLPVHYRTVITLFHLEEFSYREMEEITGMPEGTIKSYLNRARKLLKEQLDSMVKIEKLNILTDYV